MYKKQLKPPAAITHSNGGFNEEIISEHKGKIFGKKD